MCNTLQGATVLVKLGCNLYYKNLRAKFLRELIQKKVQGF